MTYNWNAKGQFNAVSLKTEVKMKVALWETVVDKGLPRLVNIKIRLKGGKALAITYERTRNNLQGAGEKY